MTQPPSTDDPWPSATDPTLVTREETLVAPPPPPVGPPPDRRIGAGMLLGLGAVALVAIGIIVAYLLTHRGNDHPVTTTVVTTQPPTLSTATPAGPIAVPDLVGQRFAGARARLESLGFAATKTDVTSDQPAGTVVGQSPAAGSKLARGSQVALSVAASTTTTTPAATTTAATTTTATTAPTTTAAVPPPPQNATMPDVSGQAEAAAVQAMGNAGLLASLAFVPSKDPLGTVEQQAKPAGTTVPYHAHVQINISKGPNSTTSAQVPSVVGQTLTEALSALNGAHLRLIYLKFPVSSRAQAGKIVQQSPLGGGEAPQNAQVLVFLGAYRAP